MESNACLPVAPLQCENEEVQRMTKFFPTSGWSRRKLLRTAPALCASAVLPRGLLAAQTDHPAPAAKPFSTFTDVASTAGLTATMYYGVPEAVTYIIEEMGGGC